MRLGRARLLASAAAMITLTGALAAAAIPSEGAVTGARVALAGSAAVPLPAGAVRVGELPTQTRLTLDVTLNLGNEAGLDALVNGLANPKSPYFRQFVGKDQFGPEFGLSLPAIAQVESTLRSLCLDPGQADPDRLYIPVTGTAAQIDRAFGIRLVTYRLAGGRVAYANSAAPQVPASIGAYIQGVLGLDNLYQPQPADYHQPAAVTALSAGTPAAPTVPAAPAVPAVHAAKPCSTATAVAIAHHGFTADQVASHYAITPLYKTGDFGTGVRVAVAELQPDRNSDITDYEKCYGISTKVEYTTVDAPVSKVTDGGEAVLDIEDIASIAPGVTIDVYQDGSDSIYPLYDIAARVAAMDRDQVFSISYGECEVEAGAALLTAYQTVFKTLNAKGITTVAAAGDSGSTSCYVGTKSSTVLSPSSPASTAYVLSVGGTALTSASPLSTEVVWNSSGTKYPGAGGGGVSSLLCMPGYQDPNQLGNGPPITGLIAKYSVRAKSCDSGNDPNGYRREVPDVSANAAESSPYPIYWKNAWYIDWGTSASTALVAAESALVDASPYCSSKGWESGTHVGMLPQALYAQVSTNNNLYYLSGPPPWFVHDITDGNNDDKASGYTGGLYPATVGYDLASGLGAPMLTAPSDFPLYFPGIANNMCLYFAAPSVANISTHAITPATAQAGHAVKVTVKGTGYLEIPLTDRAKILTNNNTKTVTFVWASCPTHGTCKLTMPGLKAGTYQVEMLVADFLPCSDGCTPYATFTVRK